MMLDTVRHQCLRLALGAFRTSPAESIYVEAEEPSLYIRREKLALQNAIRLAANPSNPTFKVTFPPHISQDIIDLYDNKPNAIGSFGYNKPNAIGSFGLRISLVLTSANINKEQIETHSVPEIPSWCIRKPKIDLSLHSEKKSEFKPSTHIYSNRIFTTYSHIIQIMNIFIQTEKNEEKVGCAAAKYDNCKKMCIHDSS